jgi:NAD(P)-dependent dehydrogenase (short-subunit alcohol dehydrogenase family)
MSNSKPLTGKVAVVAGATRGAGRGIASMLGEAGVTVYCASRSTREHLPNPGRRETIDDTAAMVTKHGGIGIAVPTDFTDLAQVRALIQLVDDEQHRLDILVNNVNGDDLVEWGGNFWDQSLEKGLRMLERGVDTHFISLHAALPLMIRSGGRLVAGVSDQGGIGFVHSFVKRSVMKMAELLAPELRPHGIATVAVTPGFLRSEAMLQHFGVTEENWRDGAKADPFFAGSESPFYVGRAIAALAADRKLMLKTGKTLSSWELADEYGFTDMNGERPHWERFAAPMIDEHWKKVTQKVRAEFKKHGHDPEATLEEDRATLTLRARIEENGHPARWYTEQLSWPELIFGDKKQLSAGIYERFALAAS